MNIQNSNVWKNSQKGVSLGLIINHTTGEIPLVIDIDHKDPQLKLPGGKIEKGETILEAFVREVREEVGISVDPKQVIFLFSVLADNKRHYYHVFAATVDNIDGLHSKPVRDGNALLETRLFKEDSIVEAKMHPQHKMMLKQAIRIVTEIIMR